MESPDLVQKNIDKIATLFPNCIAETIGDDGKLKKAINFGLLQQMLSSEVAEGDEAFEFTWVGKKAAIVEANKPIRKTLRPCPEESKCWDNTGNLYIEGDNLDVLKLLQESYLGKIKMIYIDPPYNTGNDFIYKDNFTQARVEYDDQLGIFDEESGDKLFKNTDSNGRFHSDWCSMMYSRLQIARDLLTDDGLIFISIDDTEQANLRNICDEIFGASNFISVIVWEKRYTRSNNAKLFASLTDYILLYRKSSTLSILRESRTEKNDSIYSNPDNDPRGVWTSVSYVNPASKEQRPNLCYEIINPITGERVNHPTNAWKYEYATHVKHVKENRLYWGKNGENKYPRLKKFLTEMEGGIVPANLWYHKDVGTTDIASKDLEKLIGRGIFDFPKSTQLIEKMLDIASDKNSIILDFFSGSSTTAHSVMNLNAKDNGQRKFIMVQLPESCDEKSEAYKAGYKNICEIGKERIRRAGDKIYSKFANQQSAISNQQSAISNQQSARLGYWIPSIQIGRQQYDRCLLQCGRLQPRYAQSA
jgi:adenine-specific DNA-methyltransferase